MQLKTLLNVLNFAIKCKEIWSLTSYTYVRLENLVQALIIKRVRKQLASPFKQLPLLSSTKSPRNQVLLPVKLIIRDLKRQPEMGDNNSKEIQGAHD